MDEFKIRSRCPGLKLLGRAGLDGYRIEFDKYSPTWDCGVADIVADENSQVWGLLYEITEDDLRRLDKREGYPHYYTHKKVRVKDGFDNTIKAITYEIVEKNEFVPPSTEYFDILKIAAEKYNFSEDYKQILKSIKFTL